MITGNKDNINLSELANSTFDCSKFEELPVKKQKAEAVVKNAFVFIVNLLSRRQ